MINFKNKKVLITGATGGIGNFDIIKSYQKVFYKIIRY